MNKLDYVSASVPENCKLKISPSSFASFITTPWNWYRQQILGLDKFEYSTSSVIGTIVHYVAEQVAKEQDVDEEEISKYIESFETTDDYSKTIVHSNWYYMAEVLVNSYVNEEKHAYLEVEQQACQPLGNEFYVAGTMDVLQGTKEDCMLVDYKTYSSKTKPKSIPANYRYQLLVYVWMLNNQGYNVSRIRLVYVNRNIDGGISEKTKKPLKSYPPEVTVLTEVITPNDLLYIESMLTLCKDSMLAVEKHPELLHVIFHDMRLLEK